MSLPQDVDDMERPTTGGSIKAARERAEAGIPREDFAAFARRMAQDPNKSQQRKQPPQPLQPQRPVPPQQVASLASPRRAVADSSAAGSSRIPRPQAPSALQSKDGPIGMAISRPTPIPQWPLPGPISSPPSSDAAQYRPPPGRSQPPQRPPRPSRVPSILDASKIQDHTPVFQYTPQNGRESELSVPQTMSSASRPSTVSSVGSIPDFPVPVSIPVPPRRSVNLGPPPSSRRGASSFYSNASYVSPIPEESPRSRSHASFASSAAMPESWGSPSPGPSPNYPDAFYEETITEEGRDSVYDEEGDESRLVRSASIGKRGKASLVTTPAPPRNLEPPEEPRPGPSPVQLQPAIFKDGTGYREGSSSSSSLPVRAPAAIATMDSIMNAFDAASSTDPSNPSRRMSVSPQPPSDRPYSILSAIRRPPRLDMEAVRKQESRGSLTSLPDLIRRATQLAARLDRGQRPASRIDDLDYSPGGPFGRRDGEKELSVENEKHQSGFSDMLAAFPPPAQVTRRSWRQSFRDQVGSWPLPLNNINNNRRPSNQRMPAEGDSSSEGTDVKQRRRCCGLPLWGFIIVVIIVLILIAAAIVIPLELFVIRRQSVDPSAQGALSQCQGQLTCANGGMNVVSQQGFCSCICTNGFTGFDCTVGGSNGCTTANVNLNTGDSNIMNVTLGDGIPRLIQGAQANFSIPLDGTQILAKFNSGNLSCSAENALVTFDGQSIRQGEATAEVVDSTLGVANNAGDPGNRVATVTVAVGGGQTLILDPGTPTVVVNAAGGFSTLVSAPNGASSLFPTTVTLGSQITPSILPPTTTTTVTTTLQRSSTAPPNPGPTFLVTEQTLDFARVAVLFILQQKNLANAEVAQSSLQRFFQTASAGARRQGAGVTIDQARNINLGNGNIINLVTFQVDTGSGPVGGRSAAGTKLRLMRGFDNSRWR